MPEQAVGHVAIVDYGVGNLFSVQQACEKVGINSIVTADKAAVLGAAGVILPGVGAFGDAMSTLRARDLVGLLQEVAHSGKPFVGICLGMQLMMTESEEFGLHKGLNIFEGRVVRFTAATNERHKVPQVGWNRIWPYSEGRHDGSWNSSMLRDVPAGQFMYFVHSYIPQPEDPSLVQSTTRYAHTDFCSSIARENIFACQFHPERSGPAGLRIYQNLATLLQKS